MKEFIKIMVFMLSGGMICSVFAQQTPVFTNYNYNTVIINPAHAGFYPDTDITMTNLGYFNNIEGSPRNIGITVNTPMGLRRVGLGAGVYSDQVGVTRTTSLFGAYAYKINLDDDQRGGRWWNYNPSVLSFGITGGLTKYDENLTALGITNDNEFANNVNATMPTLGIGVLYNRERLFVRVLIKPSMLFKYEAGAPLQVELNATFNYENKVEFGLGYKTNASLNCLVGFRVTNHLRFIYNYNVTLKNTPINNTHGIVLSYRFGDGFMKYSK
ncbi:PorP/SprF family type IX secretion system membrane protein [Tamlana sp. I1]|uniref:PorP/SprF family type IX secretion system membrane protein n=1 Tax=Tamlana sp. I1 TaxID=2762061 RepID=UPI0018901218|nr:PorP/SprF family type IX secretion system membrane protein [Tamlana sp. I1]